ASQRTRVADSGASTTPRAGLHATQDRCCSSASRRSFEPGFLIAAVRASFARRSSAASLGPWSATGSTNRSSRSEADSGPADARAGCNSGTTTTSGRAPASVGSAFATGSGSGVVIGSGAGAGSGGGTIGAGSGWGVSTTGSGWGAATGSGTDGFGAGTATGLGFDDRLGALSFFFGTTDDRPRAAGARLVCATTPGSVSGGATISSNSGTST